MFRLQSGTRGSQQRVRARTARTLATARDSVKSRAAVFHAFGPAAQVLKIEEQTLPPVGARQAKVHMVAAPIHHADYNIMEGTYGELPKLPAVAGLEGVGVVREAGAEAGLEAGQYVVVARPGGLGTWRTAGVFDAAELVPVPGELEPEYASVLWGGPATAAALLSEFASLKPGDVVVQNGANGLVGSSVFQLARAKGLRTVNVIRARPTGEETIEKMKGHGADLVVTEDMLHTADYRKVTADLPAPKLALNCVGGPSALALARLLAPGGTLVTYGALGRKPLQLPASLLLFRDIRMRGFWLAEWLRTREPAQRAQAVRDAVDAVRGKRVRLWLQRHAFSDLHHALAAASEPFRDHKLVLMLEK